ncbi:MAG: hypothetical protein KGM92_11200 [Acidobacteriota bacterium]|nr:hypothetical protein [Acidobacteriota bacterium]
MSLFRARRGTVSNTRLGVCLTRMATGERDSGEQGVLTEIRHVAPEWRHVA